MGLLTQAKIDRDFTGGIYLPPLGKAPPLDRLESVDYRGPLRLPLCRGSGSPMHLSLQPGQKVAKDAVLACGSWALESRAWTQAPDGARQMEATGTAMVYRAHPDGTF